MGLMKRATVARTRDRHGLGIEGRCRVGSGTDQLVVVSNISAEGCSLSGASLGMTKDQSLQIWIGADGPISGKLRWARNGRHGVRFDEPLGEERVERLRHAREWTNVVRLRRPPSSDQS
jgi:hypothetical protein